GGALPRAEAERRLGFVLQAVIEKFEGVRDYKTTAGQADYGEKLHAPLDFPRLKEAYARGASELNAPARVHAGLARDHGAAAALWQEQVTRVTADLAEEHQRQLGRLEQAHGMHLRTVADRLQERFARPLALDRVCAMIEPAMAEARAGGPGEAFA